MANRKGAPKELTKAVVETADGTSRANIIDEKSQRRNSQRQLAGNEFAVEISVPSGGEIRAIRMNAGLSQAEFARRLHLSSGYISQWERGVKRPTGAAVVLLNLIRRRGIDAIS